MTAILPTLIIAHILVAGSSAFTVRVTVAPGNEVEINSEVTLTCSYSGKHLQLVSLKWYRGNELIWRYRPTSNANIKTDISTDWTLVDTDTTRQHSIRSSSVSGADDAEYACQIDAKEDGNYGNERGSTRLMILVPPRDVQLKVAPEPLQAGTTASFTCTIAKVWPLEGLMLDIWKGRENVGHLRTPTGKKIPGDALAHSVNFPITVNITKDDNGAKVECVATYRGERFAASQELNIHFPPSSLVLEKNPGGAVKEGAEVRVTCSHDMANPRPTLRLLQHSPPDPDTTSAPEAPLAVAEGEMHVSYSLSAVDRGQNGVVFTCEATGGALQGVLMAARNITLDVLFSTDELTMTEYPQELVQEDVPTFITCLSGSGNPTPPIVWDPLPRLQYGESIKEEFIAGQFATRRLNSIYKVYPDRTVNRATYTCRLRHQPGIAHNVTLHVKFEAVLVTHGPVPATPEGGDVELSCAAEISNPATTFSWSVGAGGAPGEGVVVRTVQQPGEYYGTAAASEARVPGVTRDQNGLEVQCVPVFNGTSLPEKKQSMRLNVTYPPDVQVNVPQSTIYEGQQLTIQCLVKQGREGNPPVYTFNWYYGSVNRSQLSGEHGSELVIEDVQAENAGMYYCGATNHGGTSALAATKVNVSYRPREVAQSASNVVYAHEGRQVRLNLTVHTFPAPNPCSWTLTVPNSNILRPQGNITTEKGDEEDLYVCSLTVPLVDAKSYGTYTASVSNQAGTLLVTFVLKPYGKPGPPISVDVISDPSREVFLLSWYSGQNGGYPQTFSVFFRPVTGQESSPESEDSEQHPWRLSGENIEDPGFGKKIEHDVDVKGEEHMEYEFMVAARNLEGQTESKSIRGYTVTTPTFDGNYTFTTDAARKTVTLRWTPIVGAYSSVTLRYCPEAEGETGQCREYDVRGLSELRINGTETGTGTGTGTGVGTFRLVVTHAGRELAVSPDFQHVIDSGPPTTSTASIAGGVIGGLVVLLILILLAIIFAKKRKQRKGSDAHEVSSHSGSYVAIANNSAAAADNPYDEVVVRSPKQTGNGDPATSPDIVSSHTWQPQPIPRKKRPEQESEENPRGLSVSIPPMSPHGPQYENVNGQKEPLYDNVDVKNGHEPNQKSVIYAKLDLPEIAEGETPLIHGDTERTEYVAIDFNKRPMPIDSDSD